MPAAAIPGSKRHLDSNTISILQLASNVPSIITIKCILGTSKNDRFGPVSGENYGSTISFVDKYHRSRSTTIGLTPFSRRRCAGSLFRPRDFFAHLVMAAVTLIVLRLEGSDEGSYSRRGPWNAAVGGNHRVPQADGGDRGKAHSLAYHE